uniref:Beta-lactamase-related domain-containing protein n=1 Tax=Panagrolaimus sp. ES5 TaxID=591445 RepID=A0AC34G5R4_9BILA
MTRWQKICAIAAVTPAAYICFNNREGDKRVKFSIENKKKLAKQAIHRYMIINGVPGVSVGITVNGKSVWKNGVGYADIEQNVKCNGKTVMRIASISKSVTAVMAAKLVEDGKLDVDAPIQKYLENFPKKTFDGKPVVITSRQLMSHTSVADSLEIFQHDDLEAEPGSKFVYTTFGYSLLSHVMEKAADKEFGALLYDLTTQLGMINTQLDRNLEVVPNRSRFYRNNKNGKLENVPEVNNSYKWAGGGLLSDVGDLLTLGNALMYSK